jgi:uncharacterized protein YdhG (YjbR/CyaY superfamily)
VRRWLRQCLRDGGGRFRDGTGVRPRVFQSEPGEIQTFSRRQPVAAKPKSIDEYLATVAGDKRAALMKLRKTIRTIVPKAEECISYGIAAFRLNGKPIIGFSASKNHCTLFPMSGATVATLREELKDYETSKGAIRFSANKPLPATLIRKVIRTRIAEEAARDRK